MRSPNDVGEYVVYITVPPEVQKKECVYCACDDCQAVPSSGEENDYPSEDDIENYQSEKGYIVSRLCTCPEDVEDARKVISILNVAITQYIERGKPLDKLRDFIYGAESHILSRTEYAHPDTLLEESPATFWDRFMRGF